MAAPPTATTGDGVGTPTATATAADPAAVGEQLATALGCVGCHTIDGSVLVGPSWLGLFGRTEQLSDGSTAVADEAYLRESIVAPNAKIVEGFPGGVMLAFESLSDDQPRGARRLHPDARGVAVRVVARYLLVDALRGDYRRADECASSGANRAAGARGER